MQVPATDGHLRRSHRRHRPRVHPARDGLNQCPLTASGVIGAHSQTRGSCHRPTPPCGHRHTRLSPSPSLPTADSPIPTAPPGCLSQHPSSPRRHSRRAGASSPWPPDGNLPQHVASGVASRGCRDSRPAHRASSSRRRIVSTMRSTLGNAASSSAAPRPRHMRGGDPDTGRRGSRTPRRPRWSDLRAPATQPRVLLDRDRPGSPRDRREDRRSIERDEVNADRSLRHRSRPPHGAARRHSSAGGTIAATRRPCSRPLARPRCLAQRRPRARRRVPHPCPRTGPCARSTRRVGVPDRRCQQALHVRRVGRRHDLEARDRHRPVLDDLTVPSPERSPPPFAVRRTSGRRPDRRSCSGSLRSGSRPCPRPRRKVARTSAGIGAGRSSPRPSRRPTIACSLIGVSRTRLRPNRSTTPSVSLEHAPGRGDVLADEHDRCCRAPSPGRCRRRPPPVRQFRHDEPRPPTPASRGRDVGLRRRAGLPPRSPLTASRRPSLHPSRSPPDPRRDSRSRTSAPGRARATPATSLRAGTCPDRPASGPLPVRQRLDELEPSPTVRFDRRAGACHRRRRDRCRRPIGSSPYALARSAAGRGTAVTDAIGVYSMYRLFSHTNTTGASRRRPVERFVERPELVVPSPKQTVHLARPSVLRGQRQARLGRALVDPATP